jgi:type IV secretion system protein VirB6
MGDVQWQIFAYIVSQVETPLVTAVTSVLSAFLGYVATPLKLALVVYVALTGIAMARGDIQTPGSVVIGRTIKIAIVVWLLTGSGAYQQWVYDFFFNSLPNSLSNALTGSGAAGAVSANSFDQGWIKAWRAGLEVWNKLSWRDFGPQIAVLLFWCAAIIANVFCFAIWLISRVFLALYIALGPLLVPLVLFPATRAIFERWIGALISCVILQITTIVLLYIILLTEQQVVGTVATVTQASDMEGIQVLLSGIIFFVVAGFVALQLPGVASSLSGGLTFHTGAVARSIQNAVGSPGAARTDAGGNSYREGRGGIIGAGHYALSSAGRGAGAVGRYVSQRIRPTTGGSLSDRGGA